MPRVIFVTRTITSDEGPFEDTVVFGDFDSFKKVKGFLIRKMRIDADNIRRSNGGNPVEGAAIDAAADDFDVVKYECDFDIAFPSIRYSLTIRSVDSIKMLIDANGTLGSAIDSGR